MAYLKRAESAFELAAPDLGMISPFQIREARMMASRLEEVGGSGRDGQGLLLEDYQRTLLLMGRVLTRAALTEASLLDTVRTWNESMNLIEETPLGRQKPRTLLQADGRRSAGDEPSYPTRPLEGSGPRPPPLIRPIEEVLAIEAAPPASGGTEILGLTEVGGRSPPPPAGPEEEGGAHANPASAGEAPPGWGYKGLQAFEVHRRDPLRPLARFASGIGRDLGDLAFRRGEVRTPRLQRWSYRPLLRVLALRGLRLLAAALFLFILLDLTHYLI